MYLQELNRIIEQEHKYPVYVSDLVYPEVEEMYLNSPKLLTKSQIGAFYQKYDYQGVRNALEIINNYEEFHKEVIDNEIDALPTYISPSQFEYLQMIGWLVRKFQFVLERPWVSSNINASTDISYDDDDMISELDKYINTQSGRITIKDYLIQEARSFYNKFIHKYPGFSREDALIMALEYFDEYQGIDIDPTQAEYDDMLQFI